MLASDGIKTRIHIHESSKNDSLRGIRLLILLWDNVIILYYIISIKISNVELKIDLLLLFGFQSWSLIHRIDEFNYLNLYLFPNTRIFQTTLN